MKTIPLTRGKVAFVDDEDYERVSQYKWFARTTWGIWYAARKITNPKGSKRRQYEQQMHHFIRGRKLRTDHKDGNGLNNQKHNLRSATPSQNSANERKVRGAVPFKGVCKAGNKFAALICIDQKQRAIGYFLLAEDAARAYDDEAVRLFGEFAATNATLGLL